MDAKVLKTVDAEYVKAEYSGNHSGYNPIGDRLLVQVDEASTKTVGGIHLPQDLQYRMTLSSETGVIIAMGDSAFKWTFDRTRDWEGYKPRVGDRVYIERYAGRVVKGVDGLLYRCIDDKCVACIETE